jgi:hypothetical protein
MIASRAAGADGQDRLGVEPKAQGGPAQWDLPAAIDGKARVD